MLRHAARLSVSVATFIFGLALTAIPSLLPFDSPRAGALEQEIIDANHEYLEAYSRRDAATLDMILTDEFVVRGRFGSYDNKERRLATVTDPALESITVDSHNTRVEASESAGEVRGHAVVYGVYAGREFSSPPYRFTRKFEKRDGRWQLVSVDIHRLGW